MSLVLLTFVAGGQFVAHMIADGTHVLVRDLVVLIVVGSIRSKRLSSLNRRRSIIDRATLSFARVSTPLFALKASSIENHKRLSDDVIVWRADEALTTYWHLLRPSIAALRVAMPALFQVCFLSIVNKNDLEKTTLRPRSRR